MLTPSELPCFKCVIDVPVVALQATLVALGKNSLLNYWHLSQWALIEEEEIIYSLVLSFADYVRLTSHKQNCTDGGVSIRFALANLFLISMLLYCAC